ncbi:MAG: hypothetical protein JWN64_540 [Parcubacteria group bacterium]|nr:hypothetical protein [Parcubacteria group bacterium]
MKTLAELIARHPVPGIRLSLRRHACAEALSRVIGLPVRASQVQYSDGMLSVSLSPIVKSALSLKKEELRSELSSRGIAFTDVR